MIRLFRVFVPTSVLALLLSETVLIFSCFIIASYVVIEGDTEVFLLYDGGLTRMTLVAASVLLGLYFQNLYNEFRVRARILLVQQVCLTIGVVFFSQALLSYVDKNLMMPRWLMIMGCALLLVLLPAWRVLYTSVVFRALGAQRVLFLGTNPVAVEIAEQVRERPELGLLNIGFVSNSRQPGEELAGAKILGKVEQLREIVDRVQPERIVVGVSERRAALPMYDLLDMRFSGIHIQEASTLYETTFGRVSTRDLRPSQLIFSAELGPNQRHIAWSTAYSFVIALIGVLLAFPVMLVTALLVRLTSKGPILYRQTRVGLNGDLFTLYKFRSMRVDAEAQTGAVWASKNDPRVTPLGRHLRRTRLDELPQLFNVLKGDMAIVGPRPERPEFVRTLSDQIPFYRQRHCVKPGITGWSQINYKYGETLEDTIIKLEHDLYYIKNISPSLDAFVMFHTVKVMLFAPTGQ